MDFVGWRAKDNRPSENYCQRDTSSVDEEPNYGNSLVFRVRVGDVDVVEEEHAVEGLDEELHLPNVNILSHIVGATHLPAYKP